MEKQCGTVRSPNGFLYSLAVGCLKIYNVFSYHCHIIKNDAANMQAPFVFLSNHPSNRDFIAAALCAWPHRANFVGGSFLFSSPILSKLLHAVGAFSKSQFSPDIASVKKMIKCLREGRVLVLFPEGQIGPCGMENDLPPGLGKLLRIMGVNVVMNTLHGAYLSGPKWADSKRKRYMESECRIILKGENLKDMSPAEIEDVVKRELSYNDYDWQSKKLIPYPSKAPAKGLEKLCYKCPRCGDEKSMMTEGDRIFCSSCKNEGTMDTFGFIHPKDDGCKVFETPIQWRAYQRDCITREIDAGEFELSNTADICCTEAEVTKKIHAGDGIVKINTDGIFYDGSFLGQNDYSFRAKASSVLGLPFTAGISFEIPWGTKLFEVTPHDTRDMMKWIDAMDIIHLKSIEKRSSN